MQSINFRQAGIFAAQAAGAAIVANVVLKIAFSPFLDTEKGLAKKGLANKIIRISSCIIGAGAACAYNGIYRREIGIAGAAFLKTVLDIYNGVKVKNPDID